ncbi:MAG: hypothetical protein GY804_15520 [Alphaproteobacteria bacterium]|nr:hypothetical protein [Alphaproteobacteria bacterium]
MAWHFGEGCEYCRNCKLSCHNCEKNPQPQTVEGMQAWDIIKTVYKPHFDKFQLLEAFELAKIDGLDLELAMGYFQAVLKVT